jgi:hypothetical protein
MEQNPCKITVSIAEMDNNIDSSVSQADQNLSYAKFRSLHAKEVSPELLQVGNSFRTV